MDYWTQLEAKQVQLVSLADSIGLDRQCSISRSNDADAPWLELLAVSNEAGVLWPEWESDIDAAIGRIESYIAEGK